MELYKIETAYGVVDTVFGDSFQGAILEFCIKYQTTEQSIKSVTKVN